MKDLYGDNTIIIIIMQQNDPQAFQCLTDCVGRIDIIMMSGTSLLIQLQLGIQFAHI